mgnify:CR=1 FL=1
MSKAGTTARRLNAEQKKRLWGQWRQGESIAAIACSLGQYPASIRWVLKSHGGISPRERQRSERTLSLAERESISRGLAQGQSLRQLARELGRSASTVTCDASNNPPETRMLGQLYIDIGLAPVYPAEFVVIRITQKTAGPDSGS